MAVEVPKQYPFRELRGRPHIKLVFDRVAKLCGGAFYARRGESALIALDPDLDRVERNAYVAHEIGHDEMPGATEPRVHDFVARWLVPEEQLAQLVASICADGTPVMAWEIAEAFDVPEDVAVRACELLRRSRGLAS